MNLEVIFIILILIVFLLIINYITSVDLSSVSRIQHGQMTANFDKHKAMFGAASSTSFSLVNSSRTLDLIAPSPEVFKVWYEGLKVVIRKIHEENAALSAEERFLKAAWDAADADGSGTLTKEEIMNAVAELNIDKPKGDIANIYKTVDVDGSGTLDFREFVRFIEILKKRYIQKLLLMIYKLS
jgi:hypothetical protein